MQVKTTNSLEKELSSCSNLDFFLKENKTAFEDQSIVDVLQFWIEKKGLTRKAVIENSGLNTVYGYQLLSGHRSPSRDKLLCLAFGLNMNTEEAQELLKKCGAARLYVKNRRDSMIMYGLEKGMTICQVNEKLYDEREETLF